MNKNSLKIWSAALVVSFVSGALAIEPDHVVKRKMEMQELDLKTIDMADLIKPPVHGEIFYHTPKTYLTAEQMEKTLHQLRSSKSLGKFSARNPKQVGIAAVETAPVFPKQTITPNGESRMLSTTFDGNSIESVMNDGTIYKTEITSKSSDEQTISFGFTSSPQKEGEVEVEDNGIGYCFRKEGTSKEVAIEKAARRCLLIQKSSLTGSYIVREYHINEKNQVISSEGAKISGLKDAQFVHNGFEKFRKGTFFTESMR
ncbi:MAG: hypothetical protein KDD61_09270, partial [Bdellovibrionales bacterium]|nr:hypothetical protein [Bdellovibrionales bacterium]